MGDVGQDDSPGHGRHSFGINFSSAMSVLAELACPHLVDVTQDLEFAILREAMPKIIH